MDKVIKIERPHRIKYLDSATKANSTKYAYVHPSVESFEGFKYRLNVKYTAFKNLAALQPLYSKAIEEDIKREFNYRNKEDDDPSSISVYLNVLRPKLRKAVDSDTNNVIFTLEENPELTG